MNERKGFTLIELLVVIAVIALLMAILMPVLSRVREQAKLRICLSNLSQLQKAWIMYADTNDEKIVDGGTPSSTIDHPPDEGYWSGKDWGFVRQAGESDEAFEQRKYDAMKKGALYTYCENVKAYKCPNGKRGEHRTYVIVQSMNAS